MSRPYDAAAKELFEADPAGWAGFLGVPASAGRVTLVEAELSTVTAAVDKVIRVHDDPPWLLDVEFQSWQNPTAPRQLLKHNALLQDKYKVPVASVLVVLVESADSPSYTGGYAVAPPYGPAWEFGYTVRRVWRESIEPLLAGPLALVPVADVDPGQMPGVLTRVRDRLARETDPGTAGRLLSAAAVLLQLRYGPVTTKTLFERFPEVLEWEPFKTFREQGEAEGLRAMLLRQGRKKFGDPTPEHLAALTAVTDLARLEVFSERLLDVATWDESLLAG